MATLSVRQKFGIGLILISGLAAVVVHIVTSSFFDSTTTEEPGPDGPVITRVTIKEVSPRWRYGIMACAALGFCCLLIPPQSKSGPPALPH